MHNPPTTEEISLEVQTHLAINDLEAIKAFLSATEPTVQTMLSIPQSPFGVGVSRAVMFNRHSLENSKWVHMLEVLIE